MYMTHGCRVCVSYVEQQCLEGSPVGEMRQLCDLQVLAGAEV